MRLREALVGIQVALAFPLLSNSASLWNQLRKVAAIQPGFEIRHVLTFRVPLSVQKTPSMDAAVAAHERLLGRIRSWPDTESAAVTSTLPLGGMRSRSPAGTSFGVTPSADKWVELVFVSPELFRSLGIPVLRGRDFLSSDSIQSGPVAVVDETAATELWPAGEALGARLWTAPSRKTAREVVGIVGAVRSAGLNALPSPTIYVPYAQASGSFAASWGRLMSYVVRFRGQEEGLKNAVRQLVASVDADQAIADLRTMEEVSSRSLATRTLLASLLGVFGAVALLLAAGGIAGVVGQAVIERRTECAIRAALGATVTDLFRIVLERTLVAVCLGMVVGLAGTIALARILTPFIGNGAPLDVVGFTATGFGLLLAALGTSLATARGLVRLPIVEALRYG